MQFGHAFAHITHLDQVKAAIQGKDEFIIKYDTENGIAICNYLVNFQETFEPVTSDRERILRECRGITFDLTTGKIISRKFHKFFNLGERPETQASLVDFTKKHWILEKLDGSMITPLVRPNGIFWCTKMGRTGVAEPVDEFVSTRPHYAEFAMHCYINDWTPIFEWCSRQQRIVIDYPEERLVLTAVRENRSGEYQSHDSMVAFGEQYGIPVVRALEGSVENLEVFLVEARDLKGAEGYVIRFADGNMIKVKADEYCLVHKAIDHLRWEKDVVRLIIDEKLDDVKALLPNDLGVKADQFAADIFHAVHKVADDLWWVVRAEIDNLNGSKKRFAVEFVNGGKIDKRLSGLAFQTWDRIDEGVDGLVKLIYRDIKDSCGTQPKLNAVKHLMNNLSWYNYINQDALESLDEG